VSQARHLHRPLTSCLVDASEGDSFCGVEAGTSFVVLCAAALDVDERFAVYFSASDEQPDGNPHAMVFHAVPKSNLIARFDIPADVLAGPKHEI
jgi:hypothetical protein